MHSLSDFKYDTKKTEYTYLMNVHTVNTSRCSVCAGVCCERSGSKMRLNKKAVVTSETFTSLSGTAIAIYIHSLIHHYIRIGTFNNDYINYDIMYLIRILSTGI